MVIGFVLVELFLGFLLASVSNATQPRPSSGGRLISITFATVSYGQRLSGPEVGFQRAYEAFGADHLVTGSDYPLLQDYETCKETFVISSGSTCRLPIATRSCITTCRRCSALHFSAGAGRLACCRGINLAYTCWIVAAGQQGRS